MTINLKRASTLLVLMIGAAFTLPAVAATPIQATLYKNPNCQCCSRYAHYLDQNGFDVKVIDTNNLAYMQHQLDMPDRLQGCHVMRVNGYVVDGLVPVDIVKHMLRTKPDIAGITLPGMPVGAPGMKTGPQQGPLVIYAFSNDQPRIYAQR